MGCFVRIRWRLIVAQCLRLFIVDTKVAQCKCSWAGSFVAKDWFDRQIRYELSQIASNVKPVVTGMIGTRKDVDEYVGDFRKYCDNTEQMFLFPEKPTCFAFALSGMLAVAVTSCLLSCSQLTAQETTFRRSSLVPPKYAHGARNGESNKIPPSEQLDVLLRQGEEVGSNPKSPWISNEHFGDSMGLEPMVAQPPNSDKTPAAPVSFKRIKNRQETSPQEPLDAFRNLVRQTPGIRLKNESSQFQENGRRSGSSPSLQSVQPAPFSLNNFSIDEDARSQEPATQEKIEALPGAIGAKSASSQQRESIVENYPDGRPRVYRTVALDESGNYANDGPWRVVDRSGNTVAEGNYRKGIMHGKWGRRHVASEGGMFATKPFTSYQGPFDSVAFFKNGKLDGSWVIFDNQRRSVMEVGYKDGVRHGKASWYFPDRSPMREATFKEGVLDGEVIEWDEDQRVVSRDRYYEGRKVVRQTTRYRPDVKQSETYYLDAKLIPEGLDNWWEAKPTPFVTSGSRVQNGPVMAWYSNQQPKYKGQYKDDLPVGQFFWWHENGNRKTVGMYDVRGQRDGRWIWWHENGMKHFEGRYENGVPIGVWRSWFDNGELRRERDYDQDAGSQSTPELSGFGIISGQSSDNKKKEEQEKESDGPTPDESGSEGEETSGDSVDGDASGSQEVLSTTNSEQDIELNSGTTVESNGSQSATGQADPSSEKTPAGEGSGIEKLPVSPPKSIENNGG